MPAIQPARLKQQAALLAEHFTRPAAFVRSLHHMLDSYADRTYRPGQSGEPPPLLAAYNVRPPVLRQLLHELAPFAEAQPEQALELCDKLWEQDYLEFRLLAVLLLGQVPPQPPRRVIDRVEAWLRSGLENRLIVALLDQGLANLRDQHPERVVLLIESWLSDPDPLRQQLGLRALIPMVAEPRFENLPVFFRLISPFTRSIPSGLRPDLLDLLGVLARRSPRETAFFLRQSLETPQSPDTAWLIRQSLSSFPSEVQEGLREAVRRAG